MLSVDRWCVLLLGHEEGGGWKHSSVPRSTLPSWWEQSTELFWCQPKTGKSFSALPAGHCLASSSWDIFASPQIIQVWCFTERPSLKRRRWNSWQSSSNWTDWQQCQMCFHLLWCLVSGSGTYLSKSIREYVREDGRDVVCPSPS